MIIDDLTLIFLKHIWWTMQFF